MLVRLGFLLALHVFAIRTVYAQSGKLDSARIDDTKVFTTALGGDAKTALVELQSLDGKSMTAWDSTLKSVFERRFKYAVDETSFLEKRRSKLDTVLRIYRDYWRLSLLNPDRSYDSVLKSDLTTFLAKQTLVGCSGLSSLSSDGLIDSCLEAYVRAAGFHTTGFGRTGKYLDLLVWRRQKDTAYTFTLPGMKPTTSQVVMMDSFLTVGWEEYATLGRYFPGGWATKDALYCVSSAYDLKSEEFLVSYLAHESRHFADYKLFPNLSTADLEYRAKLTELCLAKESLLRVISFFISNAGRNTTNGHSLANYCVVRDLSRRLFQSEFEADINRWKGLLPAKINEAAFQLLKENTASLRKTDKKTTRFIKA